MKVWGLPVASEACVLCVLLCSTDMYSERAAEQGAAEQAISSALAEWQTFPEAGPVSIHTGLSRAKTLFTYGARTARTYYIYITLSNIRIF